MLIPMMHWPEGWDQPISLLENDCSSSHETLENGLPTTDRGKMAGQLLTIYLDHLSGHSEPNHNNSAISTVVHPHSEQFECHLLFDQDLMYVPLLTELEKAASTIGWTLRARPLPNQLYELLADQDDVQPVLLLACTKTLDKLRYVCRHRLVYGQTELPEDAHQRLFQVKGFLPDALQSEFGMKHLRLERRCHLFYRNSPQELINRRMHLGACDLHVHTTASDSSDTPEKVCQRAIQAGLKTIAVSDHDNLSGIERMGTCIMQETQKGRDLVFIPAVEISVQQEREIHLLAYFPLGGQQRLNHFLIEQQKSREQRNLDMIATLQSLGYDITIEDLNASGDHSVGRMQTALLLKARGYVETTAQAFNEILGEGKPAYVERPRPPMREAIWQIRLAGGVPVIAHPALYGWCSEAEEGNAYDRLLQQLSQFRNWGMLGVECFHGEARPEHQQMLARVASELGLLQTGGSDDHGSNKKHTRLYTADTFFY